RATDRAAFVGAEVLILPLAAVRSTREVSIKRDGDRLPGIAGVPLAGERIGGQTYDGEMEVALFPGDLPDDPGSIFDIEQRGAEPGSGCRPRRRCHCSPAATGNSLGCPGGVDRRRLARALAHPDA